MHNVSPITPGTDTKPPSTPSSQKSGSGRISAGMAGLLLASSVLTIFQILLAYNLIISYNQHPKNDLNLFLKFGQLVLDGQTPYQGDLPFIYQFWVVFFYLPFARLDHEVALHAWAVVNLMILFGAVILGWRAFLPALGARWLLPLYCLALALCSNAVITGHTTIITLTALAGSALLIRHGRYFWAGLPAFVLLIKPQLSFLAGLALIVLLFYKPQEIEERENFEPNWLRRAFRSRPVWRWLGGALAGTLAILVVSLLVQPDWLARYAHTFNPAQTQGELQADGTYLEYYKSIFPSFFEFLTGASQPWIAITSIVVLGSLLALGIYRLWQWRFSLPEFMAIALALTLAITPYSHIYDFPPLLLAVFVILEHIRRDWKAENYRGALIRGGTLALLFAIQPLSADYRWFYSQALVICLLALSFSPQQPVITSKSNIEKNTSLDY